MRWPLRWRLLARAMFWVAGWEFEGGTPDAPKYVLVSAPHTSNWDLPLMLAAAILGEVDLKFMVKHTVFVGPLGWLLKRLGGIPIVRHEKHSVVQQMIDRFAASESLALSIPPEGTRQRMPYWKSGFYRIALGANVPLMRGYLDYRRKRASCGTIQVLTGDVTRDMDALRAYYAEKTPRHPELFGPVRLESEVPPEEAAPRP